MRKWRTRTNRSSLQVRSIIVALYAHAQFYFKVWRYWGEKQTKHCFFVIHCGIATVGNGFDGRVITHYFLPRYRLVPRKKQLHGKWKYCTDAVCIEQWKWVGKSEILSMWLLSAPPWGRTFLWAMLRNERNSASLDSSRAGRTPQRFMDPETLPAHCNTEPSFSCNDYYISCQSQHHLTMVLCSFWFAQREKSNSLSWILPCQW